MKKKILSMLLVVTMVASIFTGCGGDDVSSTLGDADSSTNIPSNSNAFAKQKEYSLNEYLKSGETIWYRISGLGGKDEAIGQVYVIETDGTMYYCDLHSDWGIINLNWTIGDVEQMTDEEIISTIKQQYEKYYSKIVERRITGGLNEQDIEFKAHVIASDVLNKMNISNREFINALYEEYCMYDDEGYGIIETPYYRNLLDECYQECINASCDTDKAVYEIAKKYAQKYVEWYTALYEPYCKNIKPLQYKLSLISDSTGNNTETEVFMFQESVPLQATYNVEEDVWESYVCGITEMELEYVYPYEGSEGATNCFNVYDSWYGGYKVGKGYLVTRTSSPKIFKLDEVGTKGVTVDIKDRKSLFEQGSVIKLSE